MQVLAKNQWKGAHTFVSQADTVDFGFLWREERDSLDSYFSHTPSSFGLHWGRVNMLWAIIIVIYVNSCCVKQC